jgi:hypothetical protein
MEAYKFRLVGVGHSQPTRAVSSSHLSAGAYPGGVQHEGHSTFLG